MTLASLLTTDLASVFYDTDAFAESVSIKRGGTPTTTGVAVIFDEWQTNTHPTGATQTAVTMPIVTMPVTSYLIGGVQKDPRTGDKITRANGDVYEVQPIDGKRCFEPHNDAQEILVFVKKVS